ncbi:MAG: thioredoxin domain-containing protein [Flavobacteriaceae bacterium]|nr:thioredoxin domain-containing protein [Flavobacteriaceae bacterium]
MRRIVLFFVLLSSFVVSAQQWQYSFEDAQKMALGTNRYILVDFWANWCGPCKAMDVDTWGTEEVQEWMQHYVSVKIDIDTHRTLATKYNVRGIPYVFILDPLGNVLYAEMSYKDKSQMVKILKRFAVNSKYLQRELVNYYREDSFNNSLRLTQKYLDFAILTGKEKKSFLNLANHYIIETRKKLDKDGSKYQDYVQRLEFLKYLRDGYSGRFKKIKKQLKKQDLAVVAPMNLQLYRYLHYLISKNDKNKAAIKQWSDALEKNNGTRYIKMAEYVFKEGA